jgi:cellulose synthase/poly-beta-1,6-N-acetylglucosamine synthase-like glycosyltransferase
MNTLKEILNLLEWGLYIYFAIASVYIFVFAAASIFKRTIKQTESSNIRDVAVLIPAYKEDAVIVEVAKMALNQNYPNDKYTVFIIADSLAKETISQLKKLPLILIEVAFKKRTKAKAIYSALTQLDRQYDIVLVLDADNIMEDNYIDKINKAFANGYKAVQGHRIAKNMNTSIAILDAISEEINNSIFRKGHRNLGLSSALIGSGMAFQFDLFKDYMQNADAIGGFDKELEFNLLRDKIKIEYLPEAMVRDEKVQKSKVFINQRRRWLSSQLTYLVRYFPMAVYGLFKGNIDVFDKLYQMSSPPRLFLLGFVFIFSIIYGGFQIVAPQLNWFNLSYVHWVVLLLLIIIAFLLSIPLRFYSKNVLRSLFALPKVFVLMLIAFFSMKEAKNKFIHTEHGKK